MNKKRWRLAEPLPADRLLESFETQKRNFAILLKIKRLITGKSLSNNERSLLDKTERKILRLRWYGRQKRKPMSFRKIGREIGLSHESVRKIHDKSMTGIRNFLFYQREA